MDNHDKSSLDEKGMTLIELILAISILAIITVAFLSGFGQGIGIISGSGQKTIGNMQLQSIMDDLTGQPFVDGSAIDTYLGTTKGYNKKTASDVTIFTTGNSVNYYIAAEENISVNGNAVTGNQTTIVVFTQNGKKISKATAFILKGG